MLLAQHCLGHMQMLEKGLSSFRLETRRWGNTKFYMQIVPESFNNINRNLKLSFFIFYFLLIENSVGGFFFINKTSSFLPKYLTVKPFYYSNVHLSTGWKVATKPTIAISCNYTKYYKECQWNERRYLKNTECGKQNKTSTLSICLRTQLCGVVPRHILTSNRNVAAKLF